MKKLVAILTCDPAQFAHEPVNPLEKDDSWKIAAALQDLGYDSDTVIWEDETVDWSRYGAALIRTTWDYYKKPAAFLTALERLERAGCKLFNPLATVRWNHDKNYLAELSDRGVHIVPTLFLDSLDDFNFLETAEVFYGGAPPASQQAMQGTKEQIHKLIIKPTISAGAWLTYVLTEAEWNLRRDEITECFHKSQSSGQQSEAGAKQKTILIQPYIETIEYSGELSFIYFGGDFSHAVLKLPRPGDFRIQPEHGGTHSFYDPTTAELSMIDNILRSVSHPWLYARVDVVRAGNRFLLMELEMIEPHLFMEHAPDAPRLLAEKLVLGFRD